MEKINLRAMALLLAAIFATTLTYEYVGFYAFVIFMCLVFGFQKKIKEFAKSLSFQKYF